MKKRVLFYCQSLLGIGHFIRSRELIIALRDFEVCFVYGGEIVPGFEFPDGVKVVYLPAVKSDEAFSDLHVIDGALTLEEVKSQRKAILLNTFDLFAPDALIVELFPFGRKHLSFELLPLLEHARTVNPAIKVICSLRDILVSRADQVRYESKVCELMNQYFDLLLIHADPQWQRLEESFGSVGQINCAIQYTGYVARQPHGVPDNHANEMTKPPLILVSIGGGRVGHELVECAIAASSVLAMPHLMHIITGPHIPGEELNRLKNQAADSDLVTIQHYTTDFITWLQRSDLSISLAGYNTCMDILSVGARALLYPFTGQKNDEQTKRALKLNQAGLVELLAVQSLTPQRLALEIERCLMLPRPVCSWVIDLSGAERTAQLLADLLENRLRNKVESL